MTALNTEFGIDAVIIAGDEPLEVLGKTERDRSRLTVEGIPASIPFLSEYFASGRQAAPALDRLERQGIPFLSLNGAYLSQYLASRGFQTVLVSFFRPMRDDLRSILQRRRPRAVVISTTFLPFAAQIDAIAAFVKSCAPDCFVIAGGPQVWKSYLHKQRLDEGRIPDEILAAVSEHNYLMDERRPSPVDLLAISPAGEETLAEALRRLRDKKSIEGLANTAVREDGRWKINAIQPDTLQAAAVDWSRLTTTDSRIFFPVQAGLGCRCRCRFCDFAGLHPVRSRGIASLLKEIETIPCVEGFRRVYFTDDNLFPDRRRVFELCRAMADRRLKVRWRGLMRVGLIDDEVADAIAESGAFEALLGIESGDSEMLRRMNKRITPEDILAAIERLAIRGVNTKSTFIVGFPGETDESIERTVSLLNAYPVGAPSLHRYLFFLFAVLPLAEVAQPEWRERYSLRGYGFDWEHRTMSAREAAAHIEAVHERIRPELSPSYVLETPEFQGLTRDDIRNVYTLRHRLAMLQRRETRGTEEETALWGRLEALFGSQRLDGSRTGSVVSPADVEISKVF